MRPALSVTILVTLVLLLPACAGTSGSPAGTGAPPAAPPAAAPPAQPSTPAPAPMHVWRSDGYGWIVTLTGTQARTYEVTAVSCMPEPPLEQIGQPGPDGTMQFGTKNVPTETLKWEQADRATLHLIGTAANVDLLPVPGLPASCSQRPANTPQENFDIFWQTFSENYNSFLRKKDVNWAASRAQFRPMVTDETRPKALFKILTDMITPLGDSHAYIQGPDGNDFAGKRPGTRDEDDVSRQDADSEVDAHLKDIGVTNIQTFAHNRIAYADLPSGRGYLRITGFEDYKGSATPSVDSSAELKQVLDTVFTQARVSAWKGLVIDVRFNTGGDDALGLQVAARLTNTPYLAYQKQPRDDPNDPSKHGRLQAVTVTPAAGAPRYTGPVALLISDLTVSAGETFTEALLGRNPSPVRIGTPTQGVFSDDMSRLLPNGWSFTLGNEDYYAPDGKNYEGVGIPPNISEPVFTEAEKKDHLDSALDAANPPG
ncbi:MAG TPA: S41 family peptidase [Pseudonocardia sp.]|jgi:hypothetical protein|nr:S41 family peptidase [Pseudonocardia sp.]